MAFLREGEGSLEGGGSLCPGWGVRGAAVLTQQSVATEEMEDRVIAGAGAEL